jgi:hypothetical protein
MADKIEFMDFLLQLAQEKNAIAKTKKSKQTAQNFLALKDESNRLYLEAQKDLDDKIKSSKNDGKIEELFEPDSQSQLITSSPDSIQLPNTHTYGLAGPGFKLI